MSTPTDRIIDIYERHALGWDEDRQYRRPEGEPAWMRRFTEQTKPGANVLDLGCGSGVPIVPDLLAAGLSVTGIDAAAPLIGLCKQRFPEQTWLVSDIRHLNLSRQYGGILAWHSLFHLSPDDQSAVFPVFARHLDAGAPLMFTSGTERGETYGNWRGEPLYHASLSTHEYEVLLKDNGFRVLEHVVNDARCGGATIWLACRILE